LQESPPKLLVLSRVASRVSSHHRKSDALPSAHSWTAREIKNYYEVPKKLVHKFIGREDLLLKILNHFSVTDEAVPKILILHALGGQGKSQIALEHCRRSKESHRGIFWINASSEATTIQAFERLAAVLDKSLPAVLEKPEQKIKFVLDTLEHWGERWILVFDNYDSPRAFRNVKDFFPTSISLQLYYC
jgi:ATP/maltotriose-dependent transcriptional regulator MalT